MLNILCVLVKIYPPQWTLFVLFVYVTIILFQICIFILFLAIRCGDVPSFYWKQIFKIQYILIIVSLTPTPPRSFPSMHTLSSFVLRIQTGIQENNNNSKIKLDKLKTYQNREKHENKQTKPRRKGTKEKVQETHIGAETHTFAYLEISLKHKTGNHIIYAKDL